MTLDELFEEACRDQKFYSHSGGGITVSGGEPTLQADFVRALFQRCREAKISTAVETCGCIDSEELEKVLEYTDFLFFDLKAMDEQRHLKLTGKSNNLILKNARIVAGKGVPVQFRMPLIPGINDDFDNIRAISEFLKGLSTDSPFSIELMPYHRLGTGKYEALGKAYSLKGLESASPEAVALAGQHFEKQGITCLVST
jgi:pyruvate formate lyase activating enzyme